VQRRRLGDGRVAARVPLEAPGERPVAQHAAHVAHALGVLGVGLGNLQPVLGQVVEDAGPGVVAQDVVVPEQVDALHGHSGVGAMP
jgi:hypothetical protein